MLVKHNQLAKLMPKIGLMRTDLEELGSQVGYMKDDLGKYAKSHELEQFMKVQATNLEASMLEKIRDLRKEFNIAMASYEEPLDKLPNKADYVEKVEFRIYKEKFKEL